MGRTYSDAVTAGTAMKGSHVRILRGYIEQDLNAASVPFNWTWSNWSSGQDSTISVRAIYFKEMRDAIQALWNSKGRGNLPNWTQEEPRGGSTGSSDPTVIRATHVTDLRAWLNRYEDNHPPQSQGIDSKSYDPLDPLAPIIQDIQGNDWTSNIKSLSSTPLLMRLEVRGRLDVNQPAGAQKTIAFDDPVDYNKYANAYLQYKNQHMGLFPAFTHLFHNPDGAVFSSQGYRDQFASKVLTFLQRMHARGVDLEDIIIWNEPNNDPPPPDPPNPGYMTPQNFSLLMYRCWKTIFDSVGSIGFMPRLYWGGLFSNANEHYPSTYQYAAAVYDALIASGLMNSEPVAYPWTGINIHMHRLRTADRAWDLLKKTREVQRTRGDDGSLIVGEWGVTEENGPNELSELYANILQTSISATNRAQPDIMFFYKHHRDPEGGEHWGIQKYSVQTTAGVDNYELEANDSATQSLRNRFQSIMNP